MESKIPYGSKEESMVILGPRYNEEKGDYDPGVMVEWTWDQFTGKFGDVQIKPIEGAGWRVNSIHVRLGDEPATFLAGILPRTPVAWYWPDAPLNPGAMPKDGVIAGMIPGRAIVESKDEPAVPFSMGLGAYYFIDRGERGPHACWVASQNSEVVWGIGMLPGTNHHHFDVVWHYEEEISPPDPEPEPEPPPPGPEPPPTPEPDDFKGKVLAKLDEIHLTLEEILKAVL